MTMSLQNVSTRGWPSDFRCVSNRLTYFCTQIKHSHLPLPLKNNSTKVHLQLPEPRPSKHPPPCSRALSSETCTDSDVCSQRKHWLSSSPCSLPLPPPDGGKLWADINKPAHLFLALSVSLQLAVAPTWSWGKSSSFLKEPLRVWPPSAPEVDAQNRAPATPHPPAPPPRPPTAAPRFPPLPPPPPHRRPPHHPGWELTSVCF